MNVGRYLNIVSNPQMISMCLLKLVLVELLMLEKISGNLTYWTRSEATLINTAGCVIPDFTKTFKSIETPYMHRTCGIRAIFIKKMSNDKIIFHKDENLLRSNYNLHKSKHCCYQFVSRSKEPGKEDNHLEFTSCNYFTDGTIAYQVHEIIKVVCARNMVELQSGQSVYRDYFVLLKPKNIGMQFKNKKWNVLILGMDNMSRARIYDTMPKTVQYLKSKTWLDFKGYNKIGYNTFPNLMAILGGGKSKNNNMMWDKYKKEGYITAFGEDYWLLPDTFNSSGGFKYAPTDHYLRPLFVASERKFGNYMCAGKLSSGRQMLDYALQFVTTYRRRGFFGFFWINSFSHNENNLPTLLDDEFNDFLEKIEISGALHNTFVILLGDHGKRHGKTRTLIESYFEERLPMLFIRTPIELAKNHRKYFYNLVINQNRLTTPFDLQETLLQILHFKDIDVQSKFQYPSTGTNSVAQLERKLPKAKKLSGGLFMEQSWNKTCSDANIPEVWCTCHNFTEVPTNSPPVSISVNLAIDRIHLIISNIKTMDCTSCTHFTLREIIRSHVYTKNNASYYVVAFATKPGRYNFEAIIMNKGKDFKILEQIHLLDAYFDNVGCVVGKNNNRGFCICENYCKQAVQGAIDGFFKIIAPINKALGLTSKFDYLKVLSVASRQLVASL